MSFARYALYYVPPADAPWARFATQWLGWDAEKGQSCAPPPEAQNAHDFTQTPRRYGLHATLKPPFRLASEARPKDLEDKAERLAARLAPAQCDALRLDTLGSFLALRPDGDATGLSRIAEACVHALDPLRAPPSTQELARRHHPRMTPAQKENLMRWGYPHVMDGFQFHITLTSRLKPPARASANAFLEANLSPLLPAPFMLRDIALCGEDETGHFHLIRRFPLTG